MTEQDQIKALAELDGWTDCFLEQDDALWGFRFGRMYSERTPDKNYLTSYDAIIPLIQKQELGTRLRFYGNCLVLTRAYGLTDSPLELKPSQLCEALLRATNKWIEE